MRSTNLGALQNRSSRMIRTLGSRNSLSVSLAHGVSRTGFWGWFCNTHHTDIGIRFMVTAFIFLLLGGVLAAMIRLQLIRPENSLMGPDLYNQVFTMHGSTMIFLFAVPMMFQGFGVYIVPLMCGARNIAFPRLNAFSYYLYVGGALVLWGGFLTNTGPDVGWFAYVPLSGPAYSPGHRADIWSQMITFTEVSALGVAICIATTILRHRAPGNDSESHAHHALGKAGDLDRRDLRDAGGDDSQRPAAAGPLGGHALFQSRGRRRRSPYQHLFWFFGHPEVYIIFLPGAAIVSTLVECFSRRRIFGYTPIVVSVVATGFIGFSVWVHHMFATGLPQLSESFFTAASLMIVIPTGTQFFCWVATIWYGKLQLRLPMLWCFGFFFVFLIGGLSGVMLASVPSRFAGPRYLLCRRTLSLCPDWRRSFSHVRRHLFLVSEDDGTDGQRDIGKMAFLALLHRLQYHIFHAAFSGAARHAPPRLYLRPGYALAGLEHTRLERRGFHDRRTAGFSWNFFESKVNAAKLPAPIRGEPAAWNGRSVRHRRATTLLRCSPSTAAKRCGPRLRISRS